MNMSSLLMLIKSVDKAYLLMCEPILQEFSIPQTSFDIMMFLANNPQCYTAKDISEKRNIKPNVVSLYVQKLVETGFIERHDVQGDRRKIKLTCTEKAVPVIKAGHEVQKSFVRSLMNGLTQNDLEIFKNCFRVMIENAEAMQQEIINGGNRDV